MTSPAQKRFIDYYVLRSWRPYAWIGLMALVVYQPAISFGFAEWDDSFFVGDHYSFIRTLANAPKAFVLAADLSNHGSPYYRPINTLSYLFDAQWGASNPAAYHISNILMHAVAAMLLFALLRFLGTPAGRSFFLGTVFCIHPLTVHAVAWIGGRTDLLLGIFSLASLISYIRFVRDPRWHFAALHLLCWILALFTKETAAMLPILCLAYAGIYAKNAISTRRLLLVAFTWVAIGCAWFLARTAVVPALHAEFFSWREIGIGTMSYMGKILLPLYLSPYPFSPDIRWWPGIVTIAVLACIITWLGVADVKRAAWGAAWMTLFLAPTFVRGVGEAFFVESRMYLPLAGFLVLCSGVGFERRIHRPAAAWLASLAAILGLSVVSLSYMGVYRDGLTMWGFARQESPHSAVTHYNLGLAYAKQNRLAESRQQLVTAYRLNPAGWQISYDLGRLYDEMGRLDSAAVYYRRSIATKPDCGQAYTNLGIIRQQQGDLAEAEGLYRQSLAIDTADAMAHYNLGVLYRQQGSAQRADSEFVRARHLRPDLFQVKK